MGDFNIDINKNEAIGHGKLDVFCNTLNLTNLVKSDTCFTNNHKLTIDLFLTNKSRFFQYDIIILHNIIRKYENHSSITKIKNSMPVKSHVSSNNTLASVRQVTSDEVNLILKSLSAKKASGTDKIPAKLVKLASNYLSKPLATAINNSLTSSKFPDLAKVGTVIPIDKKTDDKYDKSNFRPVSLLNCFSKVYENIIKRRLTNSMYNNISSFISAYRKNYNTQHVMIRLLEEWRENLDKNYVVGGVLMDLSKAFDCIAHDLLL